MQKKSRIAAACRHHSVAWWNGEWPSRIDEQVLNAGPVKNGAVIIVYHRPNNTNPSKNGFAPSPICVWGWIDANAVTGAVPTTAAKPARLSPSSLRKNSPICFLNRNLLC